MVGKVVFEVYCYAPEEMGYHPCKQKRISEFCLRGGRCPYASAIPVKNDDILRDASIVKHVLLKLLYAFDLVYCVVKWRLFTKSTLKGLMDKIVDLENDPSFLTWAKVREGDKFQFYQWLLRANAGMLELDKDLEEGADSSDGEGEKLGLSDETVG
jgi:hypothetical protein